jgi:hypothetical protein
MMVEEDVLQRYQDEIRSLREENELLRMSARFFGALAERLHVRLQEAHRPAERRGARHDRRAAACLKSEGERPS